MKRVLLGCLFLTSTLQAKELSDTWKELSEYRVVSGLKAGVSGVGAIQSLYTGWVFAKNFGTVFNDSRPLVAFNKDAWGKWTDLIGNGAATVGLLYIAAKLGWECFPVYAKHALAIK